MFKKINRSLWKREEYFNHYLSCIPCTYSMSVNVDITNLKQYFHQLYPLMLYLITTVVNEREEFRTALDEDGNVGIYDRLSPCYTIFHKESETFSNVWTNYHQDYKTFLRFYNNDITLYGDVEGLNAKPNPPENTFPISMVPWISFDSFNLNLQKGYEYLLPIFTIGKYRIESGKYLIPLSIQAHHAVCDGFHISKFINELQKLIENFPVNSNL